MPKGLVRYQKGGVFHFLTFSCYRRLALLDSSAACRTFESELEKVRRRYRFVVAGYVSMPEHVHLLVGEPKVSMLSMALQFWQRRYYDFNVWTDKKRVEKLRYIHRNPVRRGLAAKPEDWRWSSFRHYATGEVGRAEIESEWTARGRELACKLAEEVDDKLRFD